MECGAVLLGALTDVTVGKIAAWSAVIPAIVVTKPVTIVKIERDRIDFNIRIEKF